MPHGFPMAEAHKSSSFYRNPTPKIHIFWGPNFFASTRRRRAHNSAEHFLDHTTLCARRHPYTWPFIKILGDSLHITHTSHSHSRASQKIPMNNNYSSFWGKVVVFQPTQLGGIDAFSSETALPHPKGMSWFFQIITPLPCSQSWQTMSLQKMFRYKCHTGFQWPKLTKAPASIETQHQKSIFSGVQIFLHQRGGEERTTAPNIFWIIPLCVREGIHIPDLSSKYWEIPSTLHILLTAILVQVKKFQWTTTTAVSGVK